MENFIMTFYDKHYFFKTDEGYQERKQKQDFIYQSYHYYKDFFSSKNIMLSDEKIFLLIIFDLLSRKKENISDNVSSVDFFKDSDEIIIKKIREIKEKMKNLVSERF